MPPSQFYNENVEFDPKTDDVPIGVVVPFDFALDWEYWRFLPEGVSLYFTRTPYLNKLVGTALARDVGRRSVVGRATKALSALDPAVTVYACASGSFVRGVAGERELRQSMLAAGARRAVTSSGAMLAALRKIGATRVAVASPYTKDLTDLLVGFLEEAEYEVDNAVYLGLSNSIARLSRSSVADLVRKANSPEADCVYVSCTSVRTLGIIADLEREIDKPILTTNQVTLWDALRVAGVIHRDPSDNWVLGGGNPIARSTALLLDRPYEANPAA